MTPRLHNTSALVTGSTSNIGRAIATAFAAEGSHVIVSGRDRARGAAVVADIQRHGGTADFVAADLDGEPGHSRDLAQRTLELLDGRLDILVNNAGVYPPHTTETADGELFDRIYGVNLKAPFFLTQALASTMVAAGSGSIINLGSWIARLGIASSPLYSSSKGAMETLTRAWAAQYGPQGIRVNAISPGVISGPESVRGQDDPGERMMRRTPAGASGRPEAIAAAAVYLASKEAAFVHGTVIDVDGGRRTVAVVA